MKKLFHILIITIVLFSFVAGYAAYTNGDGEGIAALFTGGQSAVSGDSADAGGTGNDASDENGAASGGAETVIVSVSAGKYVYGTLSSETQTVYDEVYDAIVNFKEDITVSTLDHDVLDAAYRSVMADYGGVFWVSGYSYTEYTKGGELERISFSPQFTMEQEEKETIRQQIAAAVSEILSGVSSDASDYEKARYVFDYLAFNVDYVAGAADNQNIISVFLNRETVCQGYACATQYLLDLLGIPCAIVTGTANGESHAWNLVRLDGDYYYLDTTWGNASYSGDGLATGSFINYNYFAVTTAELEATHTPNGDIELPLCTATEDNYYVRENLYFSAWDEESVGAAFSEAYGRGDGFCSVKFSDGDAYRQAFGCLITDQRIAEYCTGLTSLYYMEDEAQRVLTVKF